MAYEKFRSITVGELKRVIKDEEISDDAIILMSEMDNGIDGASLAFLAKANGGYFLTGDRGRAEAYSRERGADPAGIVSVLLLHDN